jgi:hypothetical protein
MNYYSQKYLPITDVNNHGSLAKTTTKILPKLNLQKRGSTLPPDEISTLTGTQRIMKEALSFQRVPLKQSVDNSDQMHNFISSSSIKIKETKKPLASSHQSNSS